MNKWIALLTVCCLVGLYHQGVWAEKQCLANDNPASECAKLWR